MMTEKIWLQRYLNNGEAIKGIMHDRGGELKDSSGEVVDFPSEKMHSLDDIQKWLDGEAGQALDQVSKVRLGQFIQGGRSVYSGWESFAEQVASEASSDGIESTDTRPAASGSPAQPVSGPAAGGGSPPAKGHPDTESAAGGDAPSAVVRVGPQGVDEALTRAPEASNTWGKVWSAAAGGASPGGDFIPAEPSASVGLERTLTHAAGGSPAQPVSGPAAGGAFSSVGLERTLTRPAVGSSAQPVSGPAAPLAVEKSLAHYSKKSNTWGKGFSFLLGLFVFAACAVVGAGIGAFVGGAGASVTSVATLGAFIVGDGALFVGIGSAIGLVAGCMAGKHTWPRSGDSGDTPANRVRAFGLRNK